MDGPGKGRFALIIFGNARRRGIQYLTVPAMCDAPVRNACARVEVYSDRLELQGIGTVPSRTLKVLPKPGKL